MYCFACELFCLFDAIILDMWLLLCLSFSLFYVVSLLSIGLPPSRNALGLCFPLNQTSEKGLSQRL